MTPEEFTRTVGGSYGSIRNTLVHTLSAEWGWLERYGGPLMQRAANHAVHHRGQVALLLRLLGHTPGKFDILFYDAEKRAAMV